MASFRISVGEGIYEIEFNRDSVRTFESLGGSITTMRDKMFNSTDLLFYVGLTMHNPDMNPNLAKKISDAAISQYGIIEAFETLADPFAEVFMSAGEKPAGKTMRLVPKVEKPAKA